MSKTDLPTRCREAAERLRPYWGEVGIEPIRCLRESADEIERLRAIVDKLPKTADGVPVVPGMTLYSSQNICGAFRKPEIVVSLEVYANHETSEWMDGHLEVELLYSTREAAEAAGGE